MYPNGYTPGVPISPFGVIRREISRPRSVSTTSCVLDSIGYFADSTIKQSTLEHDVGNDEQNAESDGRRDHGRRETLKACCAVSLSEYERRC